MHATAVYQFIETNFFDLVPADLPQTQGRSYFLREVKRHSDATHIVRIHERADGTVKEIKMAVSDRISGDAILPLTSLDDLANAITKEIRLLEQIQRESPIQW
jgi:hypothetical protein